MKIIKSMTKYLMILLTGLYDQASRTLMTRI